MVRDLLLKVKGMKSLRLDRLSKNLELVEQEEPRRMRSAMPGI